MTKTVLEIVQSVLTEISGDDVNTISETQESEDVAKLVENAYFELVSHTTWPHTRRAVALSPFSDSEKPTHMKLIDNVKELISVSYDCRKTGETRRNYRELQYKTPDDFLRMLNRRNSDDASIKIVTDTSGIELLILTNKNPEYFTSIDDTNLIFDSHDKAVDSTLVEAKFQAQAYIIPPFELRDDFVPDLPPDAFALLQSEVLSRAQFRLRQIADAKAEASVRQQSNWLSMKSWKVAGGIQYPDYGRKR